MDSGFLSSTASAFNSLCLMPVFWLVFGVLLLGLELLNQRLVYFLPGSVASVIITISLFLDPNMSAVFATPPTGAVILLIWLGLTFIGMGLTALLRPRIRRHRRRRSSRRLFSS